MRLVTILVGMFLLATSSWANTCPDRIQYANGANLKIGDRFHYPNGFILLRGTNQLFYPNGSHLKNGDRVFYSSGAYLQNGDRLYYPNGGYLLNGDRYYYANGQYLKNGDNFYYKNGSYARRSGNLYREDGTKTPFPIELHEAIGTVGNLWAQVSASEEAVTVTFNHSLVNEPQVKVKALWDPVARGDFILQLNTGRTGENVVVHLENNRVDCTLVAGGGAGQGSEFQVRGTAGKARVHVRPGHNAKAIEEAIEKILNRF